ncbi:hypothetical protein ACP70R_012122 [Stipagrostis hirtigluma subsp. patula]
MARLGLAHNLCALHKLVLLLCAAAISIPCVAAAPGGDTVTYSFPVFNATTTDSLEVATNMSILASVPPLFVNLPPNLELNRSEGFLLLSHTVDVWRAGAGGVPAREASFNTSFTVEGASPVAFVVLLARYPITNDLRGDAANYSSYGNATGGLAAVEVGTVGSYGPENPAVGLNVTVTPNTAPGARAVWIQYDAAAHRLAVYVAGAGQSRPPRALLDAPLGLANSRSTETAFVGFFAATVRDIFDGVRDWELTLDRFPGEGDGKKGTSWWVILLAVLGSVAAAAAIVAAVVCYFQSRRRRQFNTEPKM